MGMNFDGIVTARCSTQAVTCQDVEQVACFNYKLSNSLHCVVNRLERWDWRIFQRRVIP